MDESIPLDKQCQSSLEIFKVKTYVNTIISGVELCKQKIANRTYIGYIDPLIQSMIESNFSSIISRISAGLNQFHMCLNEEVVADLRYFNSLESEVDSLISQLESQKTQFLNKIDRLSREYYYADHMNAILGVKLNSLYDLFVPQREKSSEQRFFSERSRISHINVQKEKKKKSFQKQTTFLETRMDESISMNKNCQRSLEIVNMQRNINTIITGVELCKQKIANRTYYGHIDPFIQNTIEQNFCHVITQINVGLHLFLKRLNEEMVGDLRYFNSIELEVDSLTSQLKTQKTHFVNEIDRLSREYYYVDHMNVILGVYTKLDEVTNLQCDYLELLSREYYYADHMNAILGVYTKFDEVTNLQCDYLKLLQKCECLKTELSKSKMMSKSFESVQKHAINLELELQQCKEKIKNDMSFKVNKSKDFCKEREQYFEIQDLKAQFLNAKTLNVKSISAMCDKSVLIDKHD
nr:hypothetical protein [Tanacetum cinerariifolium]